MDSIDRKLINILQKDGQISHEKLGHAVGLSVSAVNERVKKLQKQGIITGWHAAISPQKVGFDVLAFLYVLLGEKSDERTFLQEVQKIKEVLEYHHITGEWSYLLKVRCKNIQHLESVLGDKIKRLSAVVRTHTVIALSTQLERNELPVEE